jgi:endonuclease/exonuclease/phosphatase (EEP) superfamily protein YafD
VHRIVGFRRRPRLRAPVLAVGVAALVVSVIGFADDLLWLAELGASFRLHLMLVALVVATLALFGRSALGAALAAMVLLLNAFVLAPLYTRDAAPAGGAGRLRLAHINMQGHSGDLDALERTLTAARPDVLVVLEPSNGWLLEVSRHAVGYRILVGPYRYRPRVLVLAARRVTNVAVPAEPGLPDSSLAFDVALDGRSLRVLAVHVVAPSTPGDRQVRDDELEAVGAWARRHRGSEIVLGDLNATPWSTALERLETSTELRNSAYGFGVQPTWPAWAGPLGIPIDQLLHSRDLTVVARDIGPGFGSEHRSLWATIAHARRG